MAAVHLPAVGSGRQPMRAVAWIGKSLVFSHNEIFWAWKAVECLSRLKRGASCSFYLLLDGDRKFHLKGLVLGWVVCNLEA